MKTGTIELADICKSYDGGQTKVLEHLSLKLEQGTVTTVHGRSGSGKSTLLNILGLLDSFDSGTYLFEGKSMGQNDRDDRAVRREKIGFIFQNYALVETASAEENILMAARYSKQDFTILQRRMKDLLERFSLTPLSQKRVSLLSGGEKQRIAIARALVKAPLLILADEPTGNLDEENASVINDVLKTYAEDGHIVLIVTHNPHIFRNVDRRIGLERGVLHAL